MFPSDMARGAAHPFQLGLVHDEAQPCPPSVCHGRARAEVVRREPSFRTWTGTPRRDLPRRFGSRQTCYDRTGIGPLDHVGGVDLPGYPGRDAGAEGRINRTAPLG
ncbi:hypothetical protein GCM10022207_51320 [Streptomyces lannensis]|uniref:Uncharacterized protein n=1 Tax=Streptomyces lannensis TaxID=766498 RepID=A0ABP7KK88_9ACTN